MGLFLGTFFWNFLIQLWNNGLPTRLSTELQLISAVPPPERSKGSVESSNQAESPLRLAAHEADLLPYPDLLSQSSKVGVSELDTFSGDSRLPQR